MEKRLEPLFNPSSLVFVGASNKPGKWGSIILSNIINGGFKGLIYPINPKEAEIQGLKAYKKVSDIPSKPDLAIIVVPPFSVPDVIDECVSKGIKAGVVITAGFAEVGDEGAQLQQEMIERAHAGGMVLVGPNCNGVMRPPIRLYSMMPPVFPPPGPMAVIAQSGNVATSIARRCMTKGFGCSCFVSSGNEADLHCEDYFSYLAEDPETKVILAYIEGFRDGRRFFEVAKKVTRKKPLVILKAGGTGAGAKAAMSHTASLAGSDMAFDAVCKQAGIIRADSIDDLCNIGAGLIGQPLPKGKRVGILTAGGGWGVLASDACEKFGLEVVTLPQGTINELDTYLPAWWNRGNPVDLVAGLRADHLWKALEALLRCPVVDGVILLGIMPAFPFKPLPPSPDQDLIDERISGFLQMVPGVFDKFRELADSHKKPVIIASEIPMIGEDTESKMALEIGKKGHVCYLKPEDAALVMASLADFASQK